MSPVSKSVIPPSTWMRRLSNAVEYRYNSDGNSSSYSSAEDNQRLDRQFIPSFMMNDDLSGRSYVDPWDMENYSFLRKQLEDINLSEDNEFSPAFESTQSDFYYVPLDNNGSPQYQYKHYIDVGAFKDGVSPQSFRDDPHGLMANVDEYDFYNEHFDSNISMRHNEESYLEFSNPSRQSERSRYNNQDYHTYTPPSIMKDIPDVYMPSQTTKLRRRASVSFRPDVEDLMGIDVFPSYKTGQKLDKNSKFWQTGKKSLADVKIKLNRRKSFHDVSSNPDLRFGKLERRKSVLDNPPIDKWKPFQTDVIPEHHTREKLEKRRSIAEMSTEVTRKPQKILKEGILQSPESRGSRAGLNVSFNGDIKLERSPSRLTLNSQPNSSLVYVYETARRRRKMFLPNTPPKIFSGDDFRYSRPEIQDAFALDPIEQYLNRPTSRYTMTNYGHLKIDYSCSWNYLDKCIAQRVCL